jgi:hypothetical protein
MKRTEASSKADMVAKASCVLVIALMLASLVYVTATALSQYGNIGV